MGEALPEGADIAGLLAAGAIAPEEGAAPDADDRMARLAAAIDALEPGREDHWTRDGRPEVRALREASGLADVTAAERDAAWADVQAAGAD